MPLPMMRKSVRRVTECYSTCPSWPRPASRWPHPRAPIPCLVGAGIIDTLPASPRARAAERDRTCSSRAPRCGTCTARGWRRRRRARRRSPILVPDGERSKNLQTVGRVYEALITRRGRSIRRDRRGRRRRHRRPGGVRRRHLPSRRPPRPRAHHADGAGRQRDRRQGRRQPCARQEPDRRLPSAARWSSAIRRCWRRCRAASSGPGSTRSSSTA